MAVGISAEVEPVGLAVAEVAAEDRVLNLGGPPHVVYGAGTVVDSVT